MSARSTTMSGADVCVLVVGAGPIGLLTANLLGAAGLQTLVVERAPTLSGVPRAVALDDEGMRVLQSTGLVERLAPGMLLGYDHHLFGRRGQLLLKVDPDTREYGYPKRNRFHQPDLEAHLLAGLERFANVEVRFGVELDGLEVKEESSSVRLRSDSGVETVTARWVLGCDGGGSTVRKLLNIAMEGRSHPEPWIVVDTENNNDTARFSRAIGSPTRPNVNVPGVEGRRRYEFMVLPGEDLTEAASEPNVRRLLRPWCDLDQVKIVRRTVYTFHSLLAERFAEGRRVFLAGDAAHMMPPFQGQGMNSGIRDAANLVWKLALVWRGLADDALLDSYEIERKPHAADMIALSRRVGSILMTRDPLRAWFRDLAFAVFARAPFTRGYLKEMRFKPAPRTLVGCFVPSGADNWPGRMFLQPDVFDEMGVRRPLDSVLGNGFALLHIGAGASDLFAEFDGDFWRRLPARRVRVLPGGLRGASEWKHVIADLGGVIEKAAPGPITLLLRPDRYVAAVLHPGEASEVAAKLAEVLHLSVRDRAETRCLA